MLRLDDVNLDKDAHGGSPPPATRRGITRWLVIPGITAILAGLVYFVWIARRPSPNAQPAPTASTDAAIGATPSLQLPDEPLPPLSQSDSFIRRLVALLSQHPTLARWLATDSLVQRTAAAVEQAGDGRSPFEHFQFARPPTRAATVPRGADVIIDPASHRRWDDLTATILSVDPQQAAELYRHVRPLFVETYRGMGHPDGNFDAAIGRAAGRVLSTPVIQDPIVVEARRGYVEHKNDELRILPGISRQLMLMGPANLTRLQEWTSRFIKAAGIAAR
jgi:hypothetical protein